MVVAAVAVVVVVVVIMVHICRETNGFVGGRAGPAEKQNKQTKLAFQDKRETIIYLMN